MTPETRCRCGQCTLRVTNGRLGWWIDIGPTQEARNTHQEKTHWLYVRGKCPACLQPVPKEAADGQADSDEA